MKKAFASSTNLPVLTGLTVLGTVVSMLVLTISPGVTSAASREKLAVAAEEDDERRDEEKALALEEQGDAGPDDPESVPTNDLCDAAEVIPTTLPALSSLVDIINATTTGDPPVPTTPCTTSTTLSRSVWFKFTPTSNGSYAFSMCSSETGTTAPDLVLALYTSAGACSGPFTQVACDDDSCITETGQPRFVKSLVAGTTYYVVAWKRTSTVPNAGQGTVQLQVSRVFPPPNDTCPSAFVLNLNRPVESNYANLRNDYQLASGSPCFGAGIGQTASTAPGLDKVYSFTAPATGNYTFRLWNPGAGANPVLYLSSACPAADPNAPVTVSCSAASNRTSSQQAAEEINCVPLLSGEKVYLFVDQTAPANGPDFFVQVENCPTNESPPNDTPATADPFSCGVSGSIAPPGDFDFFALGTVPTGSRIFAMVDAGASDNEDADLRVTTTTDTLEYDDVNTDVPWGHFAPLVAGTIGTGVSTFLRVNDFSVNGQTEPYHLYAVVQPPLAQATVETEPNEMSSMANSATNNYFYGTLNGPAPSNDTDVYGFTANAGDLIYLALDGDPLRDGTPVNAQLTIADTFSLFLSANDSGQTSNTSPGTGSLTSMSPQSPAEGILFRAPATSAYYAIVYIGTSSSAAVGAGDYLLSIAKNCTIGGGGIPHPAINLVKTTNGADNNSPPGPQVVVGTTVTFTYTVTNTGDSPLTGVAVIDDNGTPSDTSDDFLPTFTGGDTNGNATLDLTETFTFTATRFATPGQHTNVARANGDGPFQIRVTDTDSDNHFGLTAAINLIKRTNGTNNDTPPGPSVPIGSTVTFTYTVTNTGDVPLSNISVGDDNGTPSNADDNLTGTFVGGDTDGNGLLDITETFTFTATRIATSGQHSNVALATGFTSGIPIRDTDPDNHVGIAATPTPTPTATPPTLLGNISTRLRVETGDNALIGGFIVTGSAPKKVIVRGIGASLNLAGKLQNPILELHGPSGLIEANDNWMDSPNKQAIIDSGVAPTNDLESAIIATLPANGTGYTAILRGVNNGTGIGVVEAYDLDLTANSKLANISTRGLVQTGDNVLIAGTIVVGPGSRKVLVRAIGPSLSVTGKMADPTLELRDQNGALVRANDNWRSNQEAEIIATTIPPTNNAESAIVETLAGNNAAYTAIVRGAGNSTGIAVVEIYALDN